MSDLALTLKSSRHLLMESCILWMSLINQHKQAVMQIHMPWGRTLLTWMITSARGHSQPVHIASQEDWGMCDVIWYLVHHAGWAIMHCVPKCSLFLCQPMETRCLQVDLGHCWLIPGLDYRLSSLIHSGGINCLDFPAVCWMAIDWYCTSIKLDAILPTWLWM